MKQRVVCARCKQERYLNARPTSDLCQSCANRAVNRRKRGEILEPILLDVAKLLGRIKTYLEVGASGRNSVGLIKYILYRLDDDVAKLLCEQRDEQTRDQYVKPV